MHWWVPGVCSFCWNFSERQILWSLCSVDFHTFTLQLPIQTPHSVAPELHVFVSSLKISAKRAHPRDARTPSVFFLHFHAIFGEKMAKIIGWGWLSLHLGNPLVADRKKLKSTSRRQKKFPPLQPPDSHLQISYKTYVQIPLFWHPRTRPLLNLFVLVFLPYAIP